ASTLYIYVLADRAKLKGLAIALGRHPRREDRQPDEQPHAADIGRHPRRPVSHLFLQPSISSWESSGRTSAKQHTVCRRGSPQEHAADRESIVVLGRLLNYKRVQPGGHVSNQNKE